MVSGSAVILTCFQNNVTIYVFVSPGAGGVFFVIPLFEVILSHNSSATTMSRI